MRSFASLTLILCTANLAAMGCASSGAAHPKFGAGEWRVRLPATSSPIDELTHGSGDDQPAAHMPVDPPPPSASVMPVAPAEAGAPDKPRVKRAPRRAPVVASAAPAAIPAAETVAAPVAAPEPAPTTVARYEAREQAAAKQQSYRAGDAIVITSALAVTAIVIITVLMILLIKNNDY